MTDRGSDAYNISASQVKMFADCPKKWWFEYRSDKERTKDSVYLRLGSRVHEAIEDTLTADSPPPIDHEKAIVAGIQKTYATKDEYPLPDDHYEDGMAYCAKAGEILSKFQPNIRGVEVREEFGIDREDVKTGVTAIMDIVTEDSIWDWKTGSIRDETAHEEKIQGSIYMAAYLNRYGEEPKEIKFMYLKEEKARSIEPSDEVWEYMLKHAKKLVRAKEKDQFKADPGNCYWCGYEMWCDASEVGMGGVPWEEY